MTRSISSPPVRDDAIDVGVVVVTFNSAAVVGDMLRTLDEGMRGLVWRAIFVDNASTDDTVSIIETAGREVLGLDSNCGYAAAINHGSRLFPCARSILVLNADIQLMPGSVAAMVDLLEDDRVGVVAPKTYLPGDPPRLDLIQRRESSLARIWGTALLGGVALRSPALSEFVSDARAYEVVADIDWAVGAALLCSRQCIAAVGEWDESYFLYCEEVDYCHRARAAGFTIRYTPDAVVHHKGGGGSGDPVLRSMMAVNGVREYRRRHGPAASWCYLAGAVVHELTRALVGRRGARAAAVALVSPRRRPPQINAGESLMPH